MTRTIWWRGSRDASFGTTDAVLLWAPPLLPMPVMTSCVEHRYHKDDTCRIIHVIDDAVGKAFGIEPTDLPGRRAAASINWVENEPLLDTDNLLDEIYP